MTATKLTPACRRGLVVLAHGQHTGEPVYESNQTSHTDAGRLTVYWQTVRWLQEHDYAQTGGPEGQHVTLTPAGVDLARSEDLLPADAEASPAAPAPGPTEWAAELDVDLIDPAPDNPRRGLGDLTELAASIQAQGVLEPLLVTPRHDRYLLVCGARRLAAARDAELREVPCVIRAFTEAQRVAAMVIENVQRSNLTPLEEAAAYARLLEVNQDLTQRDIAKLTGVSQRTVSTRLALLELPTEAQDALETSRITLRQAEELHRLVDAGARDRVAELTRQHVAGKLSNWTPLEKHVKQDLERIRDEQKAARARDDLKAQGVTVLTEPKGGWQNRQPRPLHGQDDVYCIYWETVKVDADAHRNEGCHAAAVCQHGEVVWMCRDPKRHHDETELRLDRQAERERQKRLKEERARKEQTARRTELCERILSAGVGPGDGQLPIGELFLDLVYALADEVWVEVLKLAGQFLELQPDPEHGNNQDGWRAAIAAAIAKDPSQAALGLVLAAGERRARDIYWPAGSGTLRRHFALLEASGYQTSGAERAKLERGGYDDDALPAGGDDEEPAGG